MHRDIPAQPEYRKLAEVWYMAAHAALWRNSAAEQDAGINWETDEYLALNHDAWLSSMKVRRWRQPFLDMRVRRELRQEGVRV